MLQDIHQTNAGPRIQLGSYIDVDSADVTPKVSDTPTITKVQNKHLPYLGHCLKHLCMMDNLKSNL